MKKLFITMCPFHYRVHIVKVSDIFIFILAYDKRCTFILTTITWNNLLSHRGPSVIPPTLQPGFYVNSAIKNT